MKKIKYILMVLLATFLLAPSSWATQGNQYAVEIKSIEQEAITGDTEETAAPSFSGLEMNLNVSFVSPSDSITYKIVIQNNTSTEYILSEETPFDNSEYVTFAYELDDTTLEANGEAAVHITLTYTSAAPASYTASNRAVIKLTNAQGDEVNPNTSDSSRKLLLITVACAAVTLALVSLFSRRRHTAKRGIFGLVLALCVIPLIASAAEALALTVNVEIAITEKKYTVTYLGGYRSEFYSVSTYSFLPQDCGDYRIYINEQTAANEYRLCAYPIYESGSYAAGERVNLEEVSFDYIDINGTDGCELIDDYTVLCPEDEIIRMRDDGSIWHYDTEMGERYGITYNPDDKDVMNFSNSYIDEWASSGYMYVRTPNAFTMPAHDVVFGIITK